jgi:two-component system, OmpR family, copper resistance phosphate regulon response regulator CusR
MRTDSTRILVIEDEKKTSQFLQQGLAEGGYSVDVAEDGEDGLRLATTSTDPYDVILLDVMLPKRDGWSVISEIRKAGRLTPTLLITARDELHDRVKGLDLGADAYLVKPFEFTELMAIIRSLLRREAARQPEVVRVSDLELDLFQHKAKRNGQAIDLTPKEFALLSTLARRAGEVISRRHLTEQVWGLNFDSDTNIVDVHIRRLRSKVDDPFPKKLIHTVRGIGYVLRDSATPS